MRRRNLFTGFGASSGGLSGVFFPSSSPPPPPPPGAPGAAAAVSPSAWSTLGCGVSSPFLATCSLRRMHII